MRRKKKGGTVGSIASIFMSVLRGLDHERISAKNVKGKRVDFAASGGRRNLDLTRGDFAPALGG